MPKALHVFYQKHEKETILKFISEIIFLWLLTFITLQIMSMKQLNLFIKWDFLTFMSNVITFSMYIFLSDFFT